MSQNMSQDSEASHNDSETISETMSETMSQESTLDLLFGDSSQESREDTSNGLFGFFFHYFSLRCMFAPTFIQTKSLCT